MIHLTKPDAEWLEKLLEITVYIYAEYPELYTVEDAETLEIAKQLIKDLNS